jgi:hypothetical protein
MRFLLWHAFLFIVMTQHAISRSNAFPFCPQTPTSPRRATNSSSRRTGTEDAVTTTAADQRPVSVTQTNVRATSPLPRFQSTTVKRRGLQGAHHGQQCFLRAVVPVLQTLWCTRPSVGSHHRRLLSP